MDISKIRSINGLRVAQEATLQSRLKTVYKLFSCSFLITGGFVFVTCQFD